MMMVGMYYQFPVLMFMVVWTSMYVAYCLSPFQLGSPHPYTWVLAIGSNLALVMAFYSAYLVHFPDLVPGESRPAVTTGSGAGVSRDQQDRTIRGLIVTFFLLGMVGLTIKLYQHAAMMGGIIEYFSNPIKARMISIALQRRVVDEYDLVRTLLAYLNNFSYVNCILGGYCYATTQKGKLVCFLPLLSALMFNILIFGRYSLVTSLNFWLLAAFFSTYFQDREHRRETLRHLLRALTILVLFVLSFLTLILLLRTAGFTERSGLLGGVADYVYHRFYSYTVGNLVSLDRYLLLDGPLQHGVLLLKDIFIWFGRIGIYEGAERLTQGYDFVVFKQQVALNTYSYIRPLHEDFGLPGLLLMSYGWGLLAFASVHSFFRRFSLLRLFFVVIVTNSMIMSFFGFALSSLTLHTFNILLILAIQGIFKGQFVGAPSLHPSLASADDGSGRRPHPA